MPTPRQRRPPRSTLVIVLVMFVAAACGSTSAPTPVAGSPTVEPIAADIAYAMHQRETFGLRADRDWVEAVAVDPRATTFTLDFPMLPEEDAAFQARQADFDAMAGAVTRYAASVPDEFGGVYIDQAQHTVVALWTARPSVHRLAILEQLRVAGPLQVRLVRYSEAELAALQDRITSDWDWMHAIGALPMGTGVEVIDNVVGLQISSANPGAAALIRAHYGVPADMLRVDSDGTGVFLLPRGWVHGTVVTATGRAPGPNQLTLQWEGDGPGECGIGDVGYGVSDDGAFELPCSPGGWTIKVEASVPNADWLVVGQAHVVVPAGGRVNLRITLEPGARLNP